MWLLTAREVRDGSFGVVALVGRWGDVGNREAILDKYIAQLLSDAASGSAVLNGYAGGFVGEARIGEQLLHLGPDQVPVRFKHVGSVGPYSLMHHIGVYSQRLYRIAV